MDFGDASPPRALQPPLAQLFFSPTDISVPQLAALTLGIGAGSEHSANTFCSAALPQAGVDGPCSIQRVHNGKATEPRENHQSGGAGLCKCVWEASWWLSRASLAQNTLRFISVYDVPAQVAHSLLWPWLWVGFWRKVKRLVLLLFLCRGFKSAKCWVLFRTHLCQWMN